MSARLPTLYIPHGGGPCFFMEWTMGPRDTWDKMAGFLRGVGGQVGTSPRAILVISAHWEDEEFAVTAQADPPLLYDYYGFPEHTYRLRYDVSGSPELAERTRALLGAAGLSSRSETRRGLDHGVFIPFMLIYPEARIPVVQLSLKRGLDAALHIAAGAALAPLRDEGVLIVGSGMSYHNMEAFMRGQDPSPSVLFDRWLSDTVAGPAEARHQGLARWAEAPAGRFAHPREEHLIPLMVAAGAAEADAGRRIHHEIMNGAAISAFGFGL